MKIPDISHENQLLLVGSFCAIIVFLIMLFFYSGCLGVNQDLVEENTNLKLNETFLFSRLRDCKISNIDLEERLRICLEESDVDCVNVSDSQIQPEQPEQPKKPINNVFIYFLNGGWLFVLLFNIEFKFKPKDKRWWLILILINAVISLGTGWFIQYLLYL